MDTKEFNQFFKQLIDEERTLIEQKGHDYTQGDEDRLINFKRVGSLLGLKPIQVWAVYFYKHVDAILTYVKKGKLESVESLEGRFQDARNYLLLGLALISEEKGNMKIVAPSGKISEEDLVVNPAKPLKELNLKDYPGEVVNKI